MDSETWRRARALFDELVDTPPLEWSQRLDALGLDESLRVEVLALLQADRAELLHTALAAQAPQMLAELAEDDGDARHQRLTGQRVGAFCLLHELGRGGMGTVWLAERIDGEFRQQVAIKLIRPGWNADEVLARFRAERQILAGLTHPNIAHLIDGGVTADGRPWLALEYVEGVDLRQYCDSGRLTLIQRMSLFLTICDAVSHAHSHLVVHRDLKPSNLLVTAAGEVKLLDFGIAKLIDANAAQISTTRVFTPEYAAPEQVRGEMVTTAVDVYALGLLLYELLTGRRPYKVNNSTPAAYERAILDQEPTRPSMVVVARDGDDADATMLAAQRELTPQQLRRELRGDLDAIVLKALRKDPLQRYASVADLAADVVNHLRRLPVAARRGGWRYRASRFMRRHALLASITALAIMALAAGLLAALYQRDLARVEARKSERVLEFMVDSFRLAHPGESNGASISARELLDRGSRRVAESLRDVPEARAQLLETMGRAYVGLGLDEEALLQYVSAVALRRELGDPLALTNALVLSATSLKNLTREKKSIQVLQEARDLLAQIPNSARTREVESEILYLSGLHHLQAGEPKQAEAQWRRSITLRRDLHGPQDERALDSTLLLSRALAAQKEFDKAVAILDEALPGLRGANPPQPVQLSEALDALGGLETKRGRFDRAEAAHRESVRICEEIYGPEHNRVAIQSHNLSSAIRKQHRFVEALEPAQRALRIARANLPPTHGFTAAVLKNLGAVEFGLNRYADAKRDYQAVLDIIDEVPETPGIDVAEIKERIKACDELLAAKR